MMAAEIGITNRVKEHQKKLEKSRRRV